MRSFLMGLMHPTTKDVEGKRIIKHEILWSTNNDTLASYNYRALHAIFNAVDATKIKLISTCWSAKEDLDIFQTTLEETGDVKGSKLQMLTTRFENLCVLDVEMVVDFFAKLCDISHE